MTEQGKIAVAGGTTADIYLCAQCGSLSLELPALIDGIAKCKGCGWEGPTRELVVQSFQHTHGGDEELIRTFMREYRLLLAKELSAPLAKMLYRWGFIGEAERDGEKVVDPKQLSRYLTAIFQSSTKSIIETREVLEKERVNDRSK